MKESKCHPLSIHNTCSCASWYHLLFLVTKQMQTQSQEMPTEICLNTPSLYNVTVSGGESSLHYQGRATPANFSKSVENYCSSIVLTLLC